ncbi:MAG TPA: M14 family metallopeptidase [Candidatus Acidoferrales bacterium]|nr:M14 family metallopeptidase [Candidatus Acidoferrales bacterium]
MFRLLSRALRFLRIFLVLGVAGFVASSARAQQSNFTVGTATAAPGEKATGYINVPAGVDAATNIPVVVVHGAKPGPVLAIVSGAHGTEYASIIAVEKLIQHLDAKEISGTVILVPLVNVNSFEQKVPHVNPVDGVSMNRMYPGKADGTQTQRVSWLITKEVVEPCDYLIDLHGGDLDENLRPYSYWPKTGNEKLDGVTHAMVLAFGLDNIIIDEGRSKDPNNSRYLDNTALTRGKPAITAEAGYAGTVEPDDVEMLVRGSVNVMRYLKMLPGTFAPVENPVWFSKVVTGTSDHDGIFYPLGQKRTFVQQGMKLGYITDFFGKTIEDVRAPVTGVLLYICAVPSMKKGNTTVDVGVVATQAP